MKTKLFDKIKFYQKIDSTNLEAKRLLNEKGWEKNFVLVAKQQTAGKGRLSQKWISEKGGLWFSLVLKNNVFQSNITLFTSVILHQTLRYFLPDSPLFIKWPNDLYWKDKKLAGILTVSSKGSTIIGIGLNINQKKLPEDLREIATTIYLENERNYNTREILKKFLEEFENELEVYKKMVLSIL